MVRLEVITGPMFSGKTEELIRRLTRAAIADMKILVVTPKRDSRSVRNISDLIKKCERLRKYQKIFMLTVSFRGELEDALNHYALHGNTFDILAFDETQFFGGWLPEAVFELWASDQNLRIIASGLDMDFTGKWFEPMPKLLAMADEALKLTAICDKCKGLANLTYRKPGGSQDQIVVGDKDLYEARCRRCHQLSE